MLQARELLFFMKKCKVRLVTGSYSSSLQQVCHMKPVNGPAWHKFTVAQGLEHPTGILNVIVSILAMKLDSFIISRL